MKLAEKVKNDVFEGVSKKEVEAAIKELTKGKPKSQLAQSLATYKDRGEFDGSLKSAIKVLKQAEYEVDELFGGKSIVYKIKANSKNQDALEKQGLSSKDPIWYYDMYNEIMDGNDYTLRQKMMSDADQKFLQMLVDKHGLKY